MSALLEVVDLKTHFRPRAFSFSKAAPVKAVDGVSFRIGRGETLGLVGESGCGKTTVARAVLQLSEVTAGEVRLDGQRIDNLGPAALRPLRRRIQVVFQDPYASLNPRLTVRDILAEPIVNFTLAQTPEDIEARVATLLDKVRLPREAAGRRPHEFSGGQRQRIGIARALAAQPDLIVCDEAVSALDVSVKAQIVNLLADLQRELGLALLFISHDLAIVEHIAQRVAVMYLGRIVEMGATRDVFAAPKHPYTRALLSAVPVAEPGSTRARIILSGEPPSASNPPAGCRFHTRCPSAFDRCRNDEPQLRVADPGRVTACHLNEMPTSKVSPPPPRAAVR